MAQESGLLNLEYQFSFYGAYHRNPMNVLIHMICVWPILYSAILLFQFTPTFFSLLSLNFNFAFVFTLVYALFYILLDPKAGSFAALLCFLCWHHSHDFALGLGLSLGWKVALAAQVFCWTGQFIGHGVFEKRAPALLDNLAQALLMAPFFVLLEALSFFGYEPSPGFHSRVHNKIEANRKAWEDSKTKKTT